MALTRITKGVIKPNENYDTHNINSTGIITATSFSGPFTGSSDIQSGIITATKIDLNGDIDVDGHTELDNVNVAGVITATKFKGGDFDGRNLNISGIATFAGNVSIAGTLTYEDVTNIDSVGIVTARSGVFITGNNKYLKIGANNELGFVHTGSETFITNSTGHLTRRSDVHKWENYAGNSEYARFTSAGNLGINNVSPNARIEITDTGTAQIRTGYNATKYARIGRNSSGEYEFFSQENGSPLVFGTAQSSDGGGAERMRIDRYGNIGIGTGIPAFAAINSISAGAVRGIEIFKDGTDTGTAIKLAGRPGDAGTKHYAQLGFSGANFTSHWATYNTSGTKIGEIVIGNTGSVGINETSPDRKLHVRSDGAAAAKLGGESGSAYYMEIGQLASSGSPGFNATGSSTSMLFQLNGSEKVRINSSGRLLLGTTTEGHANGDDLTIATSGDTGITLRSGTSGAGNIYFSDATSGTGEYEGFISYGHNVNGMYFATSQSTRMFISSAGLIGINNTSPAYQLDCVGDGGGSFSASTNSTAGQLSIVGKNSGGAVSAISRIKSHPDGSSNQSHMAFETRNSSNTMVEAVRITSAQSVGIGTDNPNRKFTLYNDTTCRLNIKSLASSTVGIEFGDPADENIGYIVYDNTDDSMSFGANAGQKVKIDNTNTTFTNGILIQSSDLTKTQDGIILQRNNSSGECQIICGRSGGNYTGLEHYVAGASGVTKRHSIDYQSYHKWFAADGTTAMMTLGSDNDLSIGTTNHTARITINTGSISNAVSIRNTTGGNGTVGVLFSTQDHSTGREKAGIFHVETHGEAHYGGDLLFCLNSATGGATQVSVSDVRMRVRRDGNVMIAKAPGDAGSGGVTGIELYGGSYSMFVRSSGTPMYVGRNSTTGVVVSYMYNGTARGTVTTDGTVVAYNTSSDYRLKENEVAITNGIEKIKQLKPYTFNFKETPNKIDQGFFAHEVQSVIPGAVTGTKDSVHSSDDDKNNIKAGDIDPQQLDYAKLTPLLTAALQEAIAEIETLKSEVAALKGS